MNKAISTILISILGSFTILGIGIYFQKYLYDKSNIRSQPSIDTKSTNETKDIIPNNNTPQLKPLVRDVTLNDSIVCKWLTETECIKKLEQCVPLIQTDDPKRFPKENVYRVDPPFNPVLSNVEFYNSLVKNDDNASNPEELDSEPFIIVSKLKCPLTQKNAEILFAPITSEQEAYRYYKFMKQELGDAKSRNYINILDLKDYEAPEVTKYTYKCKDQVEEMIYDKVSKFKTEAFGFDLKLVIFDPSGTPRFESANPIVQTDGLIVDPTHRLMLICRSPLRIL